MIVVDANVVLGWVLKDNEPHRSYSAGIADLALDSIEELVAPSVLIAEVSYVLLKRGRRLKAGSARIAQLAESIDFFRVRLVETTRSVAGTVQFALRHHVTGFDAFYLALAMSTGAKLATLDGGLRTAARNAGVVLA